MPNTQLFSILTAAITISGLNLLGSKPVHAVSFNTNLIVNGDAEAGIAGANTYDVVTVPGWTTNSNFSVYRYDSDSIFPAFTSPGPVNRGNNFFGGGPLNVGGSGSSISPAINFSSFSTIYQSFSNQPNGVSSSATAFQTIDLSFDSETIDAGNTSFNLSGFLGGYSTKQDAASVMASFLDINNSILSSASIGPVTDLDRNFTTGLQERANDGLVPVGTRSILVELQMNAIDPDGSINSYNNNAYADNLSLVLTANTPKKIPEPSEVPGLLIGGALLVGAIKIRQQKLC
jgi:hypothetical protein